MFLYNFVKKHNITRSLFIIYFAGFAVVLYFASCTIFGSKGLIEYYALKHQVANKESVKAELLSKIQLKQNMVHGMNLKSLDIDLLDEQARKVLGYAGKNEVIVYQDKKSSSNN
ncbi:MAG: septum formation initiator family protein [Proteobacteria bacterium]|nr:septum formation initiator family protein [Pseudomonadota bacterium]